MLSTMAGRTLHDRDALLEMVKSKDVQKIYGPPESTPLEVWYGMVCCVVPAKRTVLTRRCDASGPRPFSWWQAVASAAAVASSGDGGISDELLDRYDHHRHCFLPPFTPPPPPPLLPPPPLPLLPPPPLPLLPPPPPRPHRATSATSFRDLNERSVQRMAGLFTASVFSWIYYSAPFYFFFVLPYLSVWPPPPPPPPPPSPLPLQLLLPPLPPPLLPPRCFNHHHHHHRQYHNYHRHHHHKQHHHHHHHHGAYTRRSP